MKLPRYNATEAYKTNNLLVPRGVLNEKMIENMLTFQVGEAWEVDDMNVRTGRKVPKLLYLWGKNKNHLIIPQNFIGLWQKQKIHNIKIQRWLPLFPKIHITDKINLRPAQEKAIVHMQKHRCGTVQLACGKGKTVLALKYISERKFPAIVIVNQTALIDQWIESIQQHLGKVRIGIIQGSILDWENKDIVIGTVQTLANKKKSLPQTFRERFGVVFYDECHHMSAPIFSQTADLFYGDRFGLTATAQRADNLEPIYMSHLGPVIYKDLTQDLIPNCTFHLLDWTVSEKQLKQTRDVSGKTHHRKLCSFFGTILPRNNFILSKIQQDFKSGRTILVLSHSVAGAQMLYKLWQHPGAGLITGKDGVKRGRTTVLKTSNPTFATFELAREALDKKSLDSLHLTTPFSSSNDLQQSVGRIQRVSEGEKKHPIVHFYEDINFGLSRAQSSKIRKYLQALKYPYKIRKVDIDTCNGQRMT